MDLFIAQSTFGPEGVVSTARALLDTRSDAAAVSERIGQDPRLRAELVSESDFYAQQSQAKAGIVESFAFLVGVIMGLGAVVAAINTMYSSVNKRSVEIGTLRLLGFSNVPIVVSVMVEALLLAFVGGLAGGAVCPVRRTFQFHLEYGKHVAGCIRVFGNPGRECGKYLRSPSKVGPSPPAPFVPWVRLTFGRQGLDR